MWLKSKQLHVMFQEIGVGHTGYYLITVGKLLKNMIDRIVLGQEVT